MGRFALYSPTFATLRRDGGAYLDKTGALADLLMGDEGMRRQRFVSFVRPRKFGKSLTLSIAAEMLAAGELPPGVKPWPGYRRVDVDALFGGLAVHTRLRAGDASLRGLLQRARFVIQLSLGGAMTGAKLEGSICSELAAVAGLAFGDKVEEVVRAAATPGGALRRLIGAVPREVPVAVLVDEYDAVIIADASEGRWDAAAAGLKALRSLMMVSKSSDGGSRIEHFILTGVGRLPLVSFLAGSNNFKDMTRSPLLSRVLGFTEAEVRAAFPRELERLAATQGVSVDAAVASLTHWYGGYCFDGETAACAPYLVLRALDDGSVKERVLAAAAGSDFLGLRPRPVVERFVKEIQNQDRAILFNDWY